MVVGASAFLPPSLDAVAPEAAGVVFVVWFFYQVYAPKLLPITTALSPLFELPDRVEDVEEKTEHLHENLQSLDDKQTHHIQVTRANARALDESRDVAIDAENVDEYLVDNGIPVTVLTKRSRQRHTQTDTDEDSDDGSQSTHSTPA